MVVILCGLKKVKQMSKSATKLHFNESFDDFLINNFPEFRHNMCELHNHIKLNDAIRRLGRENFKINLIGFLKLFFKIEYDLSPKIERTIETFLTSSTTKDFIEEIHKSPEWRDLLMDKKLARFGSAKITGNILQLQNFDGCGYFSTTADALPAVRYERFLKSNLKHIIKKEASFSRRPSRSTLVINNISSTFGAVAHNHELNFRLGGANKITFHVKQRAGVKNLNYTTLSLMHGFMSFFKKFKFIEKVVMLPRENYLELYVVSNQCQTTNKPQPLFVGTATEMEKKVIRPIEQKQTLPTAKNALQLLEMERDELTSIVQDLDSKLTKSKTKLKLLDDTIRQLDTYTNHWSHNA